MVTSCAANDQNNRMSPWNRSFSAAFFGSCRKGLSIANSFSLADLSFLDYFVGKTQSPQLISGNASDIQLQGRFIPAQLPDIVPPEIISFSSRKINSAGLDFEFEVMVADNRDTSGEIQVGVEIIFLDGTRRSVTRRYWPYHRPSRRRGRPDPSYNKG